MANEKKRGFFSWLGFGQKERADEAQAEEQKTAEQQVEETPLAEPAADSEKFAEEVVEVSEQLVHEEALQPVAEERVAEEPVAEEQVIEEAAVEEPVEEIIEVAPVAAVEHEALPLPEELSEQSIDAEEWQAEAEPLVTADVEVTEPEVEEIEDETLPSEEELDALAAEEAVMVVPVDEPVQEQEKPTKEGFFARLKRSLLKTKENLGSGFISLFRGKKIDDDLFEELEEQLLIADVGVETTRKIITNLTEGASRKQLRDAEALYGLLKEEMSEILAKVDEPLNVEGKTPFVILMVGVNGVGKTTTIGKLARQFEQQGKSVMLAAGDTFRAAAVEQLQVWGQRNDIPVIAQHTGADSASVIFDAIQAAKARNVDVLIADTAGRLQNKSHLMEELKKIVRVMKKLDENAPHEVMLTIDASTGQNAVSQAKLFHEAVGLTGITLTKLDGTAKGGVIFSVADQFGIPIRYIGVGERIEDLRPFNAGDFIEALFARED
jgi:fused signal recognition particle receptor